MAYNTTLSDRIRAGLAHHRNVEEKNMFGGVCYMLNGKMCVGVVGDEMMCRIGPDAYDAALTKRGCREMDFSGKPMKGYVYVGEEGLRTNKELEYWIGLSVAFNAQAKAAKKPGAKKRPPR